ncbi:MAG TPA: nucleotidyltransferase domain-containing protein [Thermoanaerobaculia bacterium]|nr:nucleotidyltransferase domain-containing protein [Thermoanaerobaculia bacterium]
MQERITEALDAIEHENSVRVLYACESGSRAWGFESVDSDFDVRFLYLRPTRWYLSIRPGRDVIERPVDEGLDVSGWDLQKALGLLGKSNPPLLEWLQSPIVYREVESATRRLRGLIPEYYSPVSCFHHYLHMAEGNYRKYLRGDEVWVKKYFYVLRPVLACQWIERGLGVVPTEFSRLVDRLLEEPGLRRDIEALLRAKRNGQELDRGPRIDSISEFLERELERLAEVRPERPEKQDSKALDRAFVAILSEVNGSSL